MCGIAGRNGPPVSPTDRATVLSLLRPRGPDSQGEMQRAIGENTLWMGHTRLSILDPSPAGAQPMVSHDGRWTVVFNGEIYNHRDIRLLLPGPFRGHSDTETLVECLATCGLHRTLRLLNGMFAAAAFDSVENKLHLFRDPFGVKPLYYYQGPSSLSFASEIRALHALSPGRRTLDSCALQTFLTLRYVPSPGTLFRGVRRLPPGHGLSVDLRNLLTESWSFQPTAQRRFTGSIHDAADEYSDALERAVHRQLRSDVPVGVFLSGGIDSATIATVAKKLGQCLPTFTVGFGREYRECEIEDGRQTASLLGLQHNEILLHPDRVWDTLDRIADAVEEPLGTTSVVPMWYLAKLAREHVTVAITGQGTDEPWGGYRRYQQEVLRSAIPGVTRRLGALWGVPATIVSQWRRAPDALRRSLRSLAFADLARRFQEASSLFNEEERELLTGDRGPGKAQESIDYWLALVTDSSKEDVEKMMAIDCRMDLADDLLLYTDKISMAFSLETRVPMLDLDLVKLVESFPRRFKIGVNRTKIVHKKVATKTLPSWLVRRKKQGFLVPFGAWIRGPWREPLRNVLFQRGASHFDHISSKGLTTLWTQHQSGERDYGKQLFALLTFAQWCNRQENTRLRPRVGAIPEIRRTLTRGPI
ncbi:MAG: asparagine synthase (glutamine-hydrolyzing) [Acidobacteriota bacterium]